MTALFKHLGHVGIKQRDPKYDSTDKHCLCIGISWSAQKHGTQQGVPPSVAITNCNQLMDKNIPHFHDSLSCLCSSWSWWPRAWWTLMGKSTVCIPQIWEPAVCLPFHGTCMSTTSAKFLDTNLFTWRLIMQGSMEQQRQCIIWTTIATKKWPLQVHLQAEVKNIKDHQYLGFVEFL